MATITLRGSSRSAAKAVVYRLVAALAGRDSDPSGLLDDVRRSLGVEAFKLIEANFLDKSNGGGGADSRPWAPLADQAQRGRKAILRSGNDSPLYASLRSEGPRPDQILRPEVDGVTVGTANPVATYQHRGTRTIPPRPLWPDARDWPVAWRSQLSNALAIGILRALSQTLGGSPA